MSFQIVDVFASTGDQKVQIEIDGLEQDQLNGEWIVQRDIIPDAGRPGFFKLGSFIVTPPVGDDLYITTLNKLAPMAKAFEAWQTQDSGEAVEGQDYELLINKCLEKMAS